MGRSMVCYYQLITTARECLKRSPRNSGNSSSRSDAPGFAYGMVAGVLSLSVLCFPKSTPAGTPAPPVVFASGQVTQWVATDKFVCALYVDGTIVSWDLQNAQIVGRTAVPQTPGNPLQSEIAMDLSGKQLGCAYSATTFAASTLLFLSLPELSSSGAGHIDARLNGMSETIVELDCAGGRISYEGRGQYFAGAFDFKKNRGLWLFKNPAAWHRPMTFSPPVFAMPGCAGYIAVIDGKATAHDAQGKTLWAQTLPRPTDYWTSPDRMRVFSRIFVVQDRDDDVSRLEAFDRQSGKPAWESSVAESGEFMVTNGTGDSQVFLKDEKYILRHLPKNDQVTCELSGDKDVQFTPDSRFILALSSLETKSAGAGAFSRGRPDSTLIVLDSTTGKLVRKIPLDEPHGP